MRLLTLTLPADVAIALSRFEEEHKLAHEDAAVVALREFLIAHGYIEVVEIDEETPVEGSA